jgi:hypothetical protein
MGRVFDLMDYLKRISKTMGDDRDEVSLVDGFAFLVLSCFVFLGVIKAVELSIKGFKLFGLLQWM